MKKIILVSILFIGSFGACASRNLHKKDALDPDLLRRQWSYSVKPLTPQVGVQIEYVPPVLVGNTLLFGSSRDGLTALYPKIGSRRWKLKSHNGVLSPLEVVDKKIYFTSGDGEVLCVSLDDGDVMWRYPLRNPMTSKPRVALGKVFITTSDDALVALNEKTGAWVWHYRRHNLTGPTIFGQATPFPVGDQLWVAFSDGSLVAMQPSDGKVLWERQLSSNKKFNDVIADPVRDDSVIYWPTYDGALLAISPQDAHVLWSVEDVGGAHQVTLDGDRLYVSSSNGNVYALNKTTGKTLWKFEVDRGVPGEVAIVKDYLVVPSSGEYMYLLDRDGKLMSRSQIGYHSGFVGKVAVDTTKPWFYAVSFGGNLLAYSVQSEALLQKWK